MKKERRHTKPFKVPDAYFDSLEERTVENVSLGIPKDASTFAVPPSYFTNLEKEINDRIVVPQPPKQPISLRTKWTWAAAIAACAALAVTVFSLRESAYDADTVTPLAIETYLHDHLVEYDTYDLAPLLSDRTLSNLLDESAALSQENLTDYLLEHIDETTLLND
jgi:hypothetical protein